MKRSIDKLTPWLLRPDDAASLFGTPQMIQDFRDAGWLSPTVYQPNCAEKRDAIKETGAYPAFTLALPVDDANAGCHLDAAKLSACCPK